MLLPNPELLIHAPEGAEWIIIILVVIVFFGGKKIPELARGLGRGIREFNDAKDGIKKEIEHGIKDDDVNTHRPSIPASDPTEIQEEE